MNKKKRQLIFFWTYIEWGGAQIYFIAIMKAAASDWDITVVLPRASSTEIINYIKEIGVNIEFIDTYLDVKPAPTISRKIERQWRRIVTEFKSLNFLSRFQLRGAILHIESSPWQSWIFLTILCLRGANVFTTLHNAPTTTKWRRWIWRARMHFLSLLPSFHIFTSNQDTKNKIRDLVTDSFWKNIAVTYTCVDPPQIEAVAASPFDRNLIRAAQGISEDAVVVLSVGQFVDRKGRWIFLESVQLVTKKRPEAVFVWVTPVLPDASDRSRIAQYDLGDRFRIILSASVGKSREEVLGFFRIADVFALPSYIEGLPIALLEAMALGIPSISTNVYAIPEAIYHNKTGILIRPGDAHALSEAILSLIDDKDLALKLSATGREYVLEHFDERVASQIAIAKYTEALPNAR